MAWTLAAQCQAGAGQGAFPPVWRIPYGSGEIARACWRRGARRPARDTGRPEQQKRARGSGPGTYRHRGTRARRHVAGAGEVQLTFPTAELAVGNPARVRGPVPAVQIPEEPMHLVVGGRAHLRRTPATDRGTIGLRCRRSLPDDGSRGTRAMWPGIWPPPAGTACRRNGDADFAPVERSKVVTAFGALLPR